MSVTFLSADKDGSKEVAFFSDCNTMKNTHNPGKTLRNTSSSKPIKLDIITSQFLVQRTTGIKSEATVKNPD